MADTAAASTLNILHNGKFYRSDKQTAELLRQVQHWQAGGDRALETALFEHGLKSGRIQHGSAAREPSETAHRPPLTIEPPTQTAQANTDGSDGRVPYFAHSDLRVYYVPAEMATQFREEHITIDYAERFETKLREWKEFDVSEARRLETAVQHGLATRMPLGYGRADVEAEKRHRTAATATIHVEYGGQQYRATRYGASSLDSAVHGRYRRDELIPVAISIAVAAGDLVDLQQRTVDGFTGLRIAGETNTPYRMLAGATVSQEPEMEMGRASEAVSQARIESVDVTVKEQRPSHPSWLTRTRERVERAFAWNPPSASYHAGQSITYRDRSGQAHAATITRVETTRDLDFTGWQYAFRVAVRDADRTTGDRTLTPQELQTALVMRSATSAVAQTHTPDRALPTRQAVDPPQRQPGSAWNTTVQQAWPSTATRNRVAGEQHSVIAWPMHQPKPLAFHATQARGLEQGQE